MYFFFFSSSSFSDRKILIYSFVHLFVSSFIFIYFLTVFSFLFSSFPVYSSYSLSIYSFYIVTMCMSYVLYFSIQIFLDLVIFFITHSQIDWLFIHFIIWVFEFFSPCSAFSPPILFIALFIYQFNSLDLFFLLYFLIF